MEYCCFCVVVVVVVLWCWCSCCDFELWLVCCVGGGLVLLLVVCWCCGSGCVGGCGGFVCYSVTSRETVGQVK